MQDCWKADAEERPTFSTIVTSLNNLLTPLANYLDFSEINVPVMRECPCEKDSAGMVTEL